MNVRLALALIAVAVAPMAGPAPAANASTPPTGSNPATMQDFVDLDSAVTALESETADSDTVEGLLALVPQSVYDEFPGYGELIAGTGTVPELVHSGQSKPGCVAQGSQLLPGFPPPYGHFAPASTNNFCLPNGPNGGCDLVPGAGLTYDFRAACRQHDLGYQWAPTTRAEVDFWFLVDMHRDCARRGGWRAWQQPFCYGRAAIRYAVMRAVGWAGYGNTDRPGYNRPIPPTGVPPLVANTTCGQQSHAWWHNPSGGSSVRRGDPIYLTGVVRRHSRIRFEFRTSAGTLVATHLTYFAQENCVVEHESERFNTGELPTGPITVTAVYPRWEASDEVTQQLGVIQIGGGTTTCNQPTHVWLYNVYGNTITRGQIIYPTGVVRRHTSAAFHFYDASGALFASRYTAAARDNCVIHHEPEAMSTGGFPLGTITVQATYTEWESDYQVTTTVGVYTVVAPTGGGGGPRDPCGPTIENTTQLIIPC